MIRVQQVKVPIQHQKSDIIKKACNILHIPTEQVLSYQIVKQSVDARKKEQLSYVYTIDLALADEQKILKKNKSNQVSLAKNIPYCFPKAGEEELKHPPVIVGSGPAGLFCAYELALHGYCPIVLERGRDVDSRTKDVEEFWQTGKLNPVSNVQFGEGGAGAFSDGKLNTLVKDVAGRSRYVLELLVKHGAPEDILYVNKPHVGTDILKDVVKSLRKDIIRMGGSFQFETQFDGLKIKEHRLQGIYANKDLYFDTDVLVLALGHSARDTFRMLAETNLHMEAKAFAVGMRVEHPQSMINQQQYKLEDCSSLPVASYKVTANMENDRGVYSFCMCPGGYVVNASSQDNRLAVNGMSYHDRAGSNANSAIIVSVRPEDYPGEGPLSGVRFQEELEEKAYGLAGGKIPQQLFEDFVFNRNSKEYGEFSSCTKGACAFANLRELFPEEISNAFIKGMHSFGTKISGFDRKDAILSAVESRTSSPIRIVRDENFEGSISGIYPCGEGAGYAGGIMSAAMDGLKVAEAIARKYHFGKEE